MREKAILALLTFSGGTKVHPRRIAATIKITRLIGRLTKMLKLPPESMSERRNAGSRMGPRTLAITNGASGNPRFLIT